MNLNDRCVANKIVTEKKSTAERRYRSRDDATIIRIIHIVYQIILLLETLIKVKSSIVQNIASSLFRCNADTIQ